MELSTVPPLLYLLIEYLQILVQLITSDECYKSWISGMFSVRWNISWQPHR
jgi:hypothetical protein